MGTNKVKVKVDGGHQDKVSIRQRQAWTNQRLPFTIPCRGIIACSTKRYPLYVAHHHCNCPFSSISRRPQPGWSFGFIVPSRMFSLLMALLKLHFYEKVSYESSLIMVSHRFHKNTSFQSIMFPLVNCTSHQVSHLDSLIANYSIH